MGTTIVVLDDVDLTGEQVRRLPSLGTLARYDDPPADAGEVLARLAGAEIAILGWTAVGRDVLDRLDRLRMISMWATGYDYVDVEFARTRGSDRA